MQEGNPTLPHLYLQKQKRRPSLNFLLDLT